MYSASEDDCVSDLDSKNLTYIFQLIDVSGAQVLKERMPNVQHLVVMDNCGHSCYLDRPGLLTKHFLEFYNGEPKKLE